MRKRARIIFSPQLSPPPIIITINIIIEIIIDINIIIDTIIRREQDQLPADCQARSDEQRPHLSQERWETHLGLHLVEF